MTLRERLDKARDAQIHSDRHGHESTKHLRLFLDRLLETVESVVEQVEGKKSHKETKETK